jgi:hypothetical protein
MINWNRMSHDKIKHKWTSFIMARKKHPNGMKNDHPEHISCLERESLIDNLMSRLDTANRVIDSYSLLKTCIEQGKEKKKMSHKKIEMRAAKALEKDASKYAKEAKHAKSKVKKKHDHVEEKEARSASRMLKKKAKEAHEY